MMKPEPMTRCVIIAAKEHQRPLIEALHGAGIAHINDFKPSKSSNGLRIGKPLPESSAASERLVRVRALARALGVTIENAPAAATPANLDGTLADLEGQVERLTTTRDEAAAAAVALRERETKLAPLQGLPLRLEDYKGYSSLAVLVGRVRETPELRSAIGDDHALFHDAQKGVIAVFVPAEKREKAQEALLGAGFTEVEVPEGSGSVADELARVSREATSLDARAADATAELKQLGARSTPFLLQAEGSLAVAVEKGEAPLHFAHTDYTFMADVWVPTRQQDDLRRALDTGVGANYHLEVIHAADGHGHGSSSTPGLTNSADRVEEAHEEDKHVQPPTKFSNGALARPFEAFVDMFSRPKYDEIDPTAVVAIAFPIFFGLMIGDWGFGLIMIALGALVVTKFRHLGDTVKSLGIAILAAGIVAALTGYFVFSDGFGIPNHGVPFDGLTQATCAEMMHHEATWNCLFAPGDKQIDLYYAPISKINAVPDFLAVSLVAAVFHLFIGYLFGAINEAHHSIRHMFAKIGWMLALFGLFTVIISQIKNISGARVANWLWDTLYVPLPIDGLVLGGILVLAGVVVLMIVEEGVLRYLAPIESLGLLSNIISYSRLAGVAVAKGAMIFAFNSIFLTGMIIESHGNPVLIIAGILGLVVCQLLVLGLGILSSGIQGIRLQYVEFFLKFYKGGGIPYTPFGRKTPEANTA